MRSTSARVSMIRLAVPSLMVLAIAGCGQGGTDPAPGASASGAADTSCNAEARGFFDGKDIKFVVPYRAGGGYDTYARLLSPGIEKALKASINVVNVDGGGGLTGTNTLYASDADGLSIGLISSQGTALGTLRKDPAIQFDLSDMTYIGGVGVDDVFVSTGPKSSFKSAEDLLTAKDKELIWAASGVGSSGFYNAAIFSAIFDLQKARMVAAYGGSGETVIALERGDADAVAYSPSAAKLGSSGLSPIVRMSKERSKDYPNVPTMYEIADLDAAQTGLADFLAAVSLSPTTVVAPPKVDAARATCLREALQTAATDPGIVAAGTKAGNVITYTSAAEVEKVITKDMLGVSEELKKDFMDVVQAFANQ